MMTSPKILTCCQTDSIKLECEIDLCQLFDTKDERERFEGKWDEFLESDPHNPDIFKKQGNRLHYSSEQLISEKQDDRPPSSSGPRQSCKPIGCKRHVLLL
jgi:hypothetical protein